MTRLANRETPLENTGGETTDVAWVGKAHIDRGKMYILLAGVIVFLLLGILFAPAVLGAVISSPSSGQALIGLGAWMGWMVAMAACALGVWLRRSAPASEVTFGPSGLQAKFPDGYVPSWSWSDPALRLKFRRLPSWEESGQHYLLNAGFSRRVFIDRLLLDRVQKAASSQGLAVSEQGNTVLINHSRR